MVSPPPASGSGSAPPEEAAVFRLRISRSWLFKICGSVLILGITLWLLPTERVLEGLRSIPFSLWLVCLLAFLCGHVAAAGKWWVLIERPVGLPAAVRAHFAGLAANLCLPGVAGGDVVRAGLLMRAAPDKAALAAGSLADRLIDTLALVLLSAAGLVLLGRGEGEGSGLALLQAGGLVGVLVFGAFVVFPALVARLPDGLPMIGLARKLAGAFGALARRPLILAGALGLSLGIQAGFVALTILLANAAGVEIAPAAWYFAWPLAKILAILPVSVAGLGVREASLAALLLPFGAPPAGVVAASLIWQTILFAGGLIGGLAWAASSGKAADPSRTGTVAGAGAGPAAMELAGGDGPRADLIKTPRDVQNR
ncbi:MAG: flippase-like domain-containing protein [Alphaproteobacteria bacterium]|nr:flippase-like domain-containing protein [Alphaproteobacteria bacterium]